MKGKLKYILGTILLVIAIVLGAFIYRHETTKDGISVLGYHNIVSDEDKASTYKDDRYAISVSQLRRHLDYLKEKSYDVLTMHEVQDYYDGKTTVSERAVALTFDDGYESFHTIVEPLMNEYKMHATCFVIGANIGMENYLKADQIKNSEYVEYYSHSYDMHHESNGFNRKQIQDMTLDEIDQDFKLNSVDSSYFAYPYGRSVKRIETTMNQNNVQLAFSYNQFRHVTTKDKRFTLPRYMMIDWWPDAYFKWIVD